MKQSWENEVDKAFRWHISVNKYVAKGMLDRIVYLEMALSEIRDLKYKGNASSDIMRDMASEALNKTI